MATIVVQPQTVRHSPTPPPVSPSRSLNVHSRSPTPVPNKHIPTCPPGTTAQQASPTLRNSSGMGMTTLLDPPDRFAKVSDMPPVYAIDASVLAAAVEHLASQPLPDPKRVFPWLHGLHPENRFQVCFFILPRLLPRIVPKCLRCLTIINVDSNLTRCRLRGAVTLEEVLTSDFEFLNADPPKGFSVRNFQIQTAKLAPLSDIVLYCENGDIERMLPLAQKVSMAQQSWKSKHDPDNEMPPCNTFVLTDCFKHIEEHYSELVATDSLGQPSGNVMDFARRERIEMCAMAMTSEISRNVWLGPSPDTVAEYAESETCLDFDLQLEASDDAKLAGRRLLNEVEKGLSNGEKIVLEVISSGHFPDIAKRREVDKFISMIHWLYRLANPDDEDDEMEDVNDDGMSWPSRKKDGYRILIHCPDGYTENTLVAMAYFMFAEGVPMHEAWIKLHREKGRNFFAYPSDVDFLRAIQPRLLQESPAARGLNITSLSEPSWVDDMDGSLPSRILPYMYLGSLAHANNPELLKALGIRRVLSIGEPVSWTPEVIQEWGRDHLMFIDNVQDNGVDSLTQEFDRCSEFIGRGRADGTATLVHCRVGVSRSATICIAEVMASLGMSLARAYCFVRARRLNVIIQPHLRFVYELLKWEEYQQMRRGLPIRREMEWATLAREIALMNEPYSRR